MIRIAILGGLAPAILCALALLLPLSWKRLRSTSASWAIGSIGVGLALLLVDYASHGAPALWPPDATYRIPHITLLVMAWALLERPLARLGGLIALGRFGVACACAWIIVEGLHPGYFATKDLILWCLGAGAVACVISVAKPRDVKDRWLGVWQLWLMAAMSGVSALVLFKGGSGVASQLAAGVGGIAISASLTTLVFSRTNLPRSAFYMLSVFLVAVWLCGTPMAEASYWALGTIALAALAPRLDRLRRRGKPVGKLFRAAQVIFALGALGLGVYLAEREQSSDSYADYAALDDTPLLVTLAR